MNTLKHYGIVLLLGSLVGCALPRENVTAGGRTSELWGVEQKVFELVNQYRVSKNLPLLTPNEIIAEQARTHSRAMAKKRIPFGHQGFAERVDRISRFLPLRAVGENVGSNKGYPDSAEQAVAVWLKSRDHRRNIEGSFLLTGIGVARDSKGTYYFTQIFWR
jgi:uncharacterized protein YkwD